MNYKNFKHYFIGLSLIVLVMACKDVSPREKELKINIGKPLHLNKFKTIQQVNKTFYFDEFRNNYKYTSIVFLQNNCNSCYPKFIQWQQEMDSLDIPNNYTVLFIIQGNSYDDFMTNVLDIEYIDDTFYTIMDPEGKFLEANKDIPRWIIDASVLIDSDNKIKMVGAPFATPEMTDLFHEICKQ